MELESGPRLIRSLLSPACYDHPVDRIEVVETHISWVLLTGPYAYKIKKPVNLGFLDFTSLKKRQFYCGEELRLNRPLAPQLYEEVVTITGCPEEPRVNGSGPVFDVAVKMKQFPQEAQLDRVIARGELGPDLMDRLAGTLAAFHRTAAVAGADRPFGSPDRVARPIRENFIQIANRLTDPADRERLVRLRAECEADLGRRRNDFLARRRNGFVRECHGDLHTGNIVLLEGEPVLFDRLEFDENLRWIDVMNDLAFLLMDLKYRGRAEWASRMLNLYLEESGDYGGLRVLRTYGVYRAMVRAKVAALRAGQIDSGDPEREALLRDFETHLDLAERIMEFGSRFLLIMHGLSGSGKTTLSQSLVEACGAVRIRSDVERKRAFGLSPSARSGSGLGSGLYTPAASERTYERLGELAEIILGAGYPAVVDGAFLRRADRDRFRGLARRLGVPFVILKAQAAESVLIERVIRRDREGLDASEAGPSVLNRQRDEYEMPDREESPHVLTVRTDQPVDLDSVLREIYRMTRADSPIGLT